MMSCIPPAPFQPSPAFVAWLDTLPPPKLSPEVIKARKWAAIHARARKRFEAMKGAQRVEHNQQLNGSHWSTVK